MRIDDEAIKEFRAIYAEELGEDISEDEARILATRLVSLYLKVCRLPPQAPDRSDQLHADAHVSASDI